MTSEALYHLILTTAQANTAILMMGSEGSRNDPSVTPDPYQDFDITYFVSDADFADFQQFDRSHFGDIMIQHISCQRKIAGAGSCSSWTATAWI